MELLGGNQSPTLSPGFPADLTCEKCGRHDDSLRQVTYPYVIGLLFRVLHRDYSGRWCRRHRILKLLQAALITATLGWLAIPLGLFHAPLALMKLANRSNFYKSQNAAFLASLAEAQRQHGDVDLARRTLLARTEYQGYLCENQQIEQINQGLIPKEPQFVRILGQVFGLLALAGGLGGGIGLGSSLANLGLTRLFTEQFSFFSWLIGSLLFSGAMAAGVLGVLELLLWFFEREDLHQKAFLRIMGLVCGLALFYGVLEGSALVGLAQTLSQADALPGNLAEVVFATLGRGGLFEIQHIFMGMVRLDTQSEVFLQPFPLLLAGLLWIFYFYLFQAGVSRHIDWQEQLTWLRPGEPGQRVKLAAGFLGLTGAAFALIGILSSSTQKSSVDYLEGRDHLAYGIVFSSHESYDKAIGEFEQAVALDPTLFQAHEELVKAYDDFGQTDKAIQQARDVIALMPGRAKSHYLLATYLYYDDQYDEAEAEYKQAIQLDPNYGAAYTGLGWCAYYAGKNDLAETSFRTALALDPEPQNAYLGLGYIFEDQGRTSEAVEVFSKYLELEPRSFEGHLMLGLELMDQNDYEGAMKALVDAVYFDPKDEDARMYLAVTYMQLGKFSQAEEALTKGIEFNAQWTAGHALMASALFEQNKLSRASEEIDIARSASEKSNRDISLIMDYLLDTRRYEDAEAEALARIKTGEFWASLYLDLGWAYAGQGKYQAAIEACGQADDAGADRVEVYLERAYIYQDMDEIESSLEQVRLALKFDSQNAAAHSLLSNLLYQQDNFLEAVSEAQIAVQLDPYDVEAYVNLAFAHLALMQDQDAVRAASKAAALSPQYDLPHYVLGMAYLGLGLDSEASAELGKFLQLYEDRPNERAFKTDAEETLANLNKAY